MFTFGAYRLTAVHIDQQGLKFLPMPPNLAGVELQPGLKKFRTYIFQQKKFENFDFFKIEKRLRIRK